MKLAALDKRIASWMEIHGHRLLRYALAVIFIWFGVMKLFPGMSPAESLIAQTVYWFNPSWFIPVLGAWEVLIGILLLWRPAIREALALMGLQMAGTFLPLILLPSITWQSFMIPTMEGQYIIKNLVIIAAAIVIGGTVRHKHSKLQE
jgi:uncharacterized membrane protein YkgB